MNRLTTFITIMFAATVVSAQVNVSGIVIDKEAAEPLAGASILIKGDDGKIKKYATSKSDGKFSISIPSVSGCKLEVLMMSFDKQIIPLDSVTFPLTINLEPGDNMLKEVTVKAERIREQGDTITYSVGSFAQKQDRSIGDVLARMPGINVEKSGRIQYQGEDINKFYIEGSDLLGGKYGIATNGISHEDVGAVEIMENHQPMQVLSGISFSEKAALNLKLKNKAKATWTFHGDAGAGYSQQPKGAVWDSELFAMAVMPGFQNITTLKTNNIGENLSVQATDFFSSLRKTGLHQYIGISLPSVPSLKEKRTLFNRSLLASTNSLWNLKTGEVKAQIDYSFNRVSSDASTITTYFLNSGNRVITENRHGVNRTHSLSGKFIYELNHRTAFVNNTLQTNIDWDNMHLGVNGSLPNNQSASMPEYYVKNNFKLIKRFKVNHLITFESNNEWESLPQRLSVATGGNNFRQHVSDHAFHTDENAAYAFTLKGITVSLEAGISGYIRSLDTKLTGTEIESDNLTNILNTDYLTLYVTPKFEYWVKRVNFTLNAPVSVSHYRFDQALANRAETYFSPSLRINWKPNNKISTTINGRLGRAPMNLNMIHPGFIMTNYRSFNQGVDNFYNTSTQSVSASVTYKHTRKGIFANALAMHNWTHLPYTLAQQLYGDYVVYSYTSAKNDGKRIMVNGNVGKTLDFIRGSANINGSFNRNESHLISENNTINSVGTSWSAGVAVSGSPFQWLSIDYKFNMSASRLSMNGANASWLNGMENELMLNVMPHPKWEWHISGEHYRNELTTDKFKSLMLLDTKIIFNLSKRIELSANLTNIFNKRTYNYTIYNELTSVESQRRLRGRELLISISIRK